MPFTEDNNVIGTFAPDGADHPFNVEILPRRSWGGENLFDSHAPKPRDKDGTIGPLSISDQILWRGLPGEGFADLLRGPIRCGVRGDAEMHDVTALVLLNDEHEQEPEGGRQYDEEIDRCQTAHMVPKECPPGLRWRLRAPGHILRDRGLTDLDPKLEKFAMDARCTPQ
ncbi:hypothetical protein HBA54_22455 [Pelagibius litoralis]|uniref:Uncharacterized protein n=1 Tax=Pelagibius litoralis TaxID=374515 RepID=A0A967F1J5_9PROT|nr:hypothetical protein [Pelagibius litoralis]NIA71362.1 hypothetical protein [Pelagibius litoralis]